MAHLVYKKGGASPIQFPIGNSGVSIGRHKDNDICVDDSLVSKLHMRIDVKESEADPGVVEYHIEDLESTNQTFVNNRKVTCKKLRNNDVIRIGVTILVFIEHEADSMDSTAIIKKTWIPGVYISKKKDDEKDSEKSKKKSKKVKEDQDTDKPESNKSKIHKD